MDDDTLEAVLTGYVECALWTADCNGQADHDDCSGEDCGESLRDIGYANAGNFHPDSLAEMRAQVRDFVTGAEDGRPDVFAGMDPEQIGHDFSLTRNRHGAGFWDRGLGERGTYLTDLCRPYGEAYVCIGDDDVVYHNG
jgi:hypothetical protein